METLLDVLKNINTQASKSTMNGILAIYFMTSIDNYVLHDVNLWNLNTSSFLNRSESCVAIEPRLQYFFTSLLPIHHRVKFYVSYYDDFKTNKYVITNVGEQVDETK